jgi:phenylpropionate dioxygenase-like ring-hydroxylating dioxygenase large terminal subunit
MNEGQMEAFPEKADELIKQEPSQYLYDWYSPLRSQDVKVGEIKLFKFMGHELVAFRDQNKKITVLDSHCPHMGANLGHDGKIVDGKIQCPFHGLQLNSDGRCVGGAFLKKETRLNHIVSVPWVCEEVASSIFIWHGKERTKPTRPLKLLTLDTPEWSNTKSLKPKVSKNTHILFMTENIVDVQHFYSIHFWNIEKFIQKPHIDEEGMFRAIIQMNWRPLAQNNTSILKKLGSYFQYSFLFDIAIYGPGIAIAYATIPALGNLSVRIYILMTPINEKDTHIKVVSAVKKDSKYAAFIPKPLQNVLYDLAAQIFCFLGTTDFKGDINIWSHRKFIKSPRLIEEDGPIYLFRKWTLQFWPDI